MVKEVRRHTITFEVNAEEAKMMDQRSQQEGIIRSEYLRECFYLELMFSGDLEAMKFLGRRLGKRLKDTLVDKVAGVDVKAQVEQLMSGQ